jgi:hypothetical protein
MCAKLVSSVFAFLIAKMLVEYCLLTELFLYLYNCLVSAVVYVGYGPVESNDEK